MKVTSWFKVTTKHREVIDDKIKTITDVFLIEAVSYTDAEVRAYELLAAGGKEDFAIHAITKMKLAEVFFIENGEELWFKVRVQYIIFDEKSKTEKKTTVLMLINAKGIVEAHHVLKKQLGVIEDYIISDINTTKILEVFPLDPTQE